MFTFIRIILCAIVFGIVFCVLNYFRLNKSRIVMVLFVVFSGLLFIGLCFVPFENLFVTFDSPEKSFSYVTGTDQIIEVVEGKDTDLVLGSKNGKTQIVIIPKKDNGWGVGLGIQTRKIKSRFKDGIAISVFQYQSSEEYYISVLDAKNGDCNIEDNLSNNYVEIPISNTNMKTYYAYLPQYSDCQIKVNGIEFFVD